MYREKREEKREKSNACLEPVFSWLKVHLTAKKCFAKIIRLILWSNLAKYFFDLVKSSNFYAPSKPGFQWFATAHEESNESVSCDVKSRTHASAVPLRSSIFYECSCDFAAQVFHWDSTVNLQISIFSNNVFYFVGFRN